jgi:hypothetical protein
MLLNFMLNSEFTQEWFPSAPPGDYNGNGTVDAGDYITWRKGLGTTYDQNHYIVWRAHFGQMTGSGTGTCADVAVPEPASGLWMVFVVLSVVHSRLHAPCRKLNRR